MAIQPPSDIILDVARNADSKREAAAVRRLEALAAGSNAGGADFASALEHVNATQNPSPQTLFAAGASGAHRANRSSMGGDRSAQVAQDFEASILGSFVNEMMPKEASAVYGQGVGGDIWRSMLSEQVGRQLAKSGTLGLARRLFATHPIENLDSRHSKFASSPGAVQQTAQASTQALSMPISASNPSGARRS